MQLEILLLLVLALMTTFVLIHRLVCYGEYLRKMKTLPTIKCHPILGHIAGMLFLNKKKLFERTKQLLEQGSLNVLWLGPSLPIVVLWKANDLQKILASSTNIEKTMQYKMFQPWLGNGILTSKAEKWHHRRKLIIPAFNFKILEKFIEVFAAKASVMVKKLEKELESESLDIFPYASACALDTICETAMGIEMNAQEDNRNSEYLNAVKRMTDAIGRRILFPWLYPDCIYFLTPDGRRFKKDAKTVHDLTVKVIHEKRLLHAKKKPSEADSDDDDLGIKKRKAFLDLLLESADNESLSDEDIKEEVEGVMFGGHDTIATVLSFGLRRLASCPDVPEKIVEEQNSIFTESYQTPTLQELNEMKYLEMVIKECLRLSPPIPIIGRCTSIDVEIGGHIVPAGTLVAIPIFMTHLDPEQFPDPGVFNPENFLPERAAKRSRYAFIPFSAGPRNCIGHKFAMLELKVLFSYILRHYKLELAGDKPKLALGVVTNSLNGMQLKLSRRQRNYCKVGKV